MYSQGNVKLKNKKSKIVKHCAAVL